MTRARNFDFDKKTNSTYILCMRTRIVITQKPLTWKKKIYIKIDEIIKKKFFELALEEEVVVQYMNVFPFDSFRFIII